MIIEKTVKLDLWDDVVACGHMAELIPACLGKDEHNEVDPYQFDMIIEALVDVCKGNAALDESAQWLVAKMDAYLGAATPFDT